MFIAELLTYDKILPVAVFGAFTAFTWWLFDFMSNRSGRSVERLEELKRPRRRRSLLEEEPREETPKRGDAISKVLDKAAPALSKPLEPKSEGEKSQLALKLSYAGFRSETAVQKFLGFKFLGLVVGLAIGGATFYGMYGLGRTSSTGALIVTAFFFYLPDLVVWFLARRRQTAIFLSLPDALDLLVVCVEAGLGLEQAMRKVADELEMTHPIIAKEFARANVQLQMGRTKAEVLHEMGERSGVQDLRSLAGVIIQAEKFGSSIAQALRVQSNSMRTRRRQIAEEKAAKTAVQLIFPLVMFIFPGIFVVLVGPAAITMVRNLFPLMAGG